MDGNERRGVGAYLEKRLRSVVCARRSASAKGYVMAVVLFCAFACSASGQELRGVLRCSDIGGMEVKKATVRLFFGGVTAQGLSSLAGRRGNLAVEWDCAFRRVPPRWSTSAVRGGKSPAVTYKFADHAAATSFVDAVKECCGAPPRR